MVANFDVGPRGGNLNKQSFKVQVWGRKGGCPWVVLKL